MENNKVTAQLSNNIGKMLRENFGKGPEFVYVSMGKTFVTFYIRNFMSPSERILMDQKKEKIVQQTRDTLMKFLIPEIKTHISLVAGLEVKEVYYDWGLHNKSAMFTAIISDETKSEQPISEEYHGRDELHKEIDLISQRVQKSPDEQYSCMLNSRTIVHIRNGILVPIEKALIRQGLEEDLRVTKRQLEKSHLHRDSHFERILGAKVLDIFVDWDFDLDKSVILIIMNPKI